MVTPAVKREAVAHLVEHHEVSQRRACQVIGCCRMTVRYASVRTDDAVLRGRMKSIAQERRRFGYRRIHVLLKREGHAVNHKRLFRLYREEKLSVRKRGGRRRAIGTRAPLLAPLLPNQRWSLDFVSDQMTDGRRFRVLTVVDDCTRECLALVADTSLSGLRVARELTRLMRERGKPQMVVSDNVLRAESALESSHDVSDCKIAPAASFWSTQIRDKPKARRLPRVMEKISSIANTGSRKRLALTVLNTSF